LPAVQMSIFAAIRALKGISVDRNAALIGYLFPH
jgi:hypothetical protein